MQTQVKYIIDNEYGTSAFAVLNSNEGLLLKKFLPDDTLKAKIGEMLEGILRNNYLDEEAQVDSSDNIADNSKIFYEIIQSTEYQPFAFLDTFDSVTESYSESDAEQIMGFAFRFNVNDSGISSLNKSIQKHNNLMDCQPYVKHRFRQKSERCFCISSGHRDQKGPSHFPRFLQSRPLSLDRERAGDRVEPLSSQTAVFPRLMC